MGSLRRALGELSATIERTGRIVAQTHPAHAARGHRRPRLRRARAGARSASPGRAYRRNPPQSQDLTSPKSGRAPAQLPPAGQMRTGSERRISYLKDVRAMLPGSPTAHHRGGRVAAV